MWCVKCDGCGMELSNADADGWTLDYYRDCKVDGVLHKDYCDDCWAAFQEWISGEAVRRQTRKVS